MSALDKRRAIQNCKIGKHVQETGLKNTKKIKRSQHEGNLLEIAHTMQIKVISVPKFLFTCYNEAL